MSDYERIAKIIRYLDRHHTEQPDLAVLAGQAGLSRFHFHRLFSRWAGITPKDFLQCLTLAHAKKLLRQGQSVLHAAIDTGLSGPGRLHDLCVSLEAASPGELKSGGAGWTIQAGFAESPFGTCLVGQSPRGICHLSFVDSKDCRLAAEVMARSWPQAQIACSDAAAQRIIDTVFQNPCRIPASPPLRLYLRGTPFQLRVWRALVHVPRGTLVSYGNVAAALGDRAAARAVGAAVGQNQLAYLIPCHRVIRTTGVVGEYRWERTRKQALIAWETAGRSPS